MTMRQNPEQQNASPEPLQLLRPKEAAAVLNISPRHLWKLTQGGDVPHVRLGRSVRYSLADLEECISKNKKGGHE